MSESSGPRLIDHIRQQFHAARQSILIPEWGREGDPLEIFWTPLTAHESESIKVRAPKSEADYNLLVLMSKARTSEGGPLFELGDRYMLETEADYTVIVRVVNAMLAPILSVDDAKKNSETITG